MSASQTSRGDLIAYVLQTAEPFLGHLDEETVAAFRRIVPRLDSRALVAAAEEADQVRAAASHYPEMAECCGEAEARVTCDEFVDDFLALLEAGWQRLHERRTKGVHGVETRIDRAGFATWEVTRLQRPDRFGPRPRQQRGGCARRRGSRRATGSGSRAGPGDPDSDDPPGEVEAPPAGRQIAELAGGAT